jgi:hypothetical protein
LENRAAKEPRQDRELRRLRRENLKDRHLRTTGCGGGCKNTTSLSHSDCNRRTLWLDHIAVPEQSAMSRRSSRTPLWTFAAIAGLAIAFAAFFAYEAHEARAKADASASELAAKERELAELRGREDAGTLAAMKARVSPPPPGQRSTRFDNRPASSRPSGIPSTIPRDRLPGLAKIQRQDRLRMLRSIYDTLLTQFNLSPVQRDRFYDLQLAADDPSSKIQKLLTDDATPEERAQFGAQFQQVRDSALSQIQDIVGPEGYPLYQSYRETQEERQMAEQFRQQLDSKLQMTDWQFTQVRDALVQASKQYPSDNNDHTAAYQAAVAQAAQFLTPEQLDTFRDYLETQQQIRNDLIREIVAPLEKSLFPPGQ